MLVTGAILGKESTMKRGSPKKKTSVTFRNNELNPCSRVMDAKRGPVVL
jgi:hypothetical protein